MQVEALLDELEPSLYLIVPEGDQAAKRLLGTVHTLFQQRPDLDTIGLIRLARDPDGAPQFDATTVVRVTTPEITKRQLERYESLHPAMGFGGGDGGILAGDPQYATKRFCCPTDSRHQVLQAAAAAVHGAPTCARNHAVVRMTEC